MRPLHEVRPARDATAAAIVPLLGIIICLAPAAPVTAQQQQQQQPSAVAQPATSPADPKADPKPDVREALHAALDAHGWTRLPLPVVGVRYSGPTPAAKVGAPPGPLWYSTAFVPGNSRPGPNEARERAFRTSVEAAHAGRTNLIEGGEVLLVDPGGAIWAVAAHMPHLLRCFDGKQWTYRRADGRPAADDEPEQFARLAAEGKLPEQDNAPGTRRDRNDPGRWYPGACADRAGNLHFVGACVADDAVARDAGGGGIHTRRPDGTWEFFRIYPGSIPRHDLPFDRLRFVLRGDGGGGGGNGRAAAVAKDRAAPERDGGDLVTLGKLHFTDPVLESHGLKVEPIPPSPDAARRHGWTERSDDTARAGPVYFAQFDGRKWRVIRSSVGWGPGDQVSAAWPQQDGRIYLANHFGLWEQWPAGAERRAEGLIADLFGADEAKRAAATETLTSMGRLAAGAIRRAIEEASTDRTRESLRTVLDAAEAVGRGDEGAVPVVAGRWRFLGVVQQAAMPDGRFVLYVTRAIDVRVKREVTDCLAYFDPVTSSFDVRPIDRAKWSAAGFGDARQRPARELTVIDGEGGLWADGGFRIGADGTIERVVPAGLSVRLPEFADPEGRVYLPLDGATMGAKMIYRRGPELAHGPGGAGAAGRDGGPAPAIAKPPAEPERQFEHVRGLFSQPELAPPWNAWAIQSRPGENDVLLRLDGPEPTRVDLPPEGRGVEAVVPLDGGCIAARRGAAMFWDGKDWDVAPDVRTLVERHGARLAKMATARAIAVDTSSPHGAANSPYSLMLAADGRGGLWLTEDTPRDGPAVGPADESTQTRGRRLWHWDGQRFTDLWTMIPVKPNNMSDGAVLVAEQGRGLVVQVGQAGAAPGGYWVIYRFTKDDQDKPEMRAMGIRGVGLFPRLLAALGPNTIFSTGMWTDHEGWLWSPIFSRDGTQWLRRQGAQGGTTGVSQFVHSRDFVQAPGGPVWFASRRLREGPTVWADVTAREGDKLPTSPRVWVVTEIPGAAGPSRLAVAPDGETYLLHERGLSHLRVRKMPPGAKPRFPTKIVRAPKSSPGEPVAEPLTDAENWTIEEVARREWPGPRNDFSRIAFDKTGVWFLPREGPLVRVPRPE